tara:strand:- start:132 stop:839 length:708 start_codon:yes stop_codon:yes gene_type:complete
MYDITYFLEKNRIFDDLHFPRLVSFPRTGSHWFRVMMEKYTGMPSVVRSFYDPNPKCVWGFHIHDRFIGIYEHSEGPTRNLKNVIYLYRNPCDTIFSLLKYDNVIPQGWRGNFNKQIMKKTISYSKEYRAHLDRWLNNNSDIENIIIIKYEDLKQASTFRQVIEFLGFLWDEEKFLKILKQTDKKSIKNLTIHDDMVINVEDLNAEYAGREQRKMFRKACRTQMISIFGDYFENY